VTDTGASPEYLAVADALLTRKANAATTEAWWPKACALLLRLALEQAVNEYWQRVSPAVAQHATFRAKLLLMRRRCDRTTARAAAYSWAVLSLTLHYRSYELDPTATELRRLHDAVTAIVAVLSTPEVADLS
jgi:hypothetical protein